MIEHIESTAAEFFAGTQRRPFLVALRYLATDASPFIASLPKQGTGLADTDTVVLGGHHHADHLSKTGISLAVNGGSHMTTGSGDGKSSLAVRDFRHKLRSQSWSRRPDVSIVYPHRGVVPAVPVIALGEG